MWTVLQLESELALMQRTALRAFLQMGLRSERMVARNLFGMIDVNTDSLLQLHEVQSLLRFLQLPSREEDCAMWLRAFETTPNPDPKDARNEITLHDFHRFLEGGDIADELHVAEALAAAQAGGNPLSKRWQPKVAFKDLGELSAQYVKDKAPADGASGKDTAIEEVKQPAQPLVIYVQQERKKKADELKRRDADITAEHKRLLERYEKEEIEDKGSNPRPDGDALVFMFSFINLPKKIEFHGLPDFEPETDRQYEGKQYFKLHELAYFYIRPIPTDRSRQEHEEPLDRKEEDERTLSEEQKKERARLEDEKEERRERMREPIGQYSIYMHVKVDARPNMPVHLIEICPYDEMGDDMVAIQLESNLKVSDTTQADSDARTHTRSLRMKEKHWEQLAVVVDVSRGMVSVYLNGELMMEVQDSKKITAGVRRNDKGKIIDCDAFALWTHAGLKMFQETDVAFGASSHISLRQIAITQKAMTREEVRAQATKHGAWPCKRCQKLLGSDHKKCWNCKFEKERSASEPPDPLAKNGDVEGVRTVVANTFKEEVFKHTASKGANLVLFYSKSKVGAKELLEEYGRFGRIFRESSLRISLLDVDENDLNEAFSDADKQALELKAVPFCRLFFLDAAAPVKIAGGSSGSNDYALVKAAPGDKQKVVVLRLQAAREDPLVFKPVDVEGASKGSASCGGKVVEATGPATVKTFLEFLKEASAQVGVEPSNLFGDLDLTRHLRGCFAQYWRKTDLEFRFASLRKALVEFKIDHCPESIVEVKRFLQMWLSHGSGLFSNFQPEKSENQLLQEQMEEKEKEKEAWEAEVHAKNYSKSTIKGAKEKWDDERRAEKVAKTAQQKEMDEATEVSSLVDKILFKADALSSKLGETLAAEVDKELRRLCRALEETYATQPGTFLSRFMLEEKCVIPSAKPVALISMTATATAKSPRDQGGDTKVGEKKQEVRAMNFTEVIAIWPTVRRIVVGSPDDAQHKKMIEELRELLKKGLPVESKPFGYSMLYLACAQGNKDLVELLAEFGANLHALSKDRVLPIEVAAMMGEFTVVRQLLKNGSYFGSAMHFAAAAGQREVVQELLDFGMDPCIGHIAPGASKDKTPLELAVMHEHAPVVHVLWQKLKDIEDKDYDPDEPENDFDAARSNVLARVKKDIIGSSQASTMTKGDKAKREKNKLLDPGNASKRRNLFDRETARLPPNLRESKLLKNARRGMDADGGTASETSKKDVRAVAEGGKGKGDGGEKADDDGPPGGTIEDFAAVRDYLNGLPVKKPKNADAEDSLGWTALSYAALLNNAEWARKLLEGGWASHTRRNRHGFSAVMWARWQGSKDFLQVLHDLCGGETATRPDSTELNGISVLSDVIEASNGDPAIESLLRIRIDQKEKTRCVWPVIVNCP